MPSISRFLPAIFLLIPAFFAYVVPSFGQSELSFSIPGADTSQNYGNYSQTTGRSYSQGDNSQNNGQNTTQNYGGQNYGQNQGYSQGQNTQPERNQDIINNLRRNVRTVPPEIAPSYDDARPLVQNEPFRVETVSPNERFVDQNPLRTAGTTANDNQMQARLNTYRTMSYSDENTDDLESEGSRQYGDARPLLDSPEFAAEGLPSLDGLGSPGDLEKPAPRTGVSAEIRKELDDKYAALPSLSPPSNIDSEDGENKSESKKSSMPFELKSILPVVGSLVLVLGAFFLFAVLMRKVNPRGTANLPKEAFEVIGKTQLTPKQQLHLLRVGSRLVLVAVSLDGIQPITEITEPDEVVKVLGLVRRKDSNGSSAAFNKILDQYAAEPTEGGYFGAEAGNRKRAANLSRARLHEEEEMEEESLATILAGGAEKLISGGKRSQNARSQAARSYAHG